jgi:hypothetical protein
LNANHGEKRLCTAVVCTIARRSLIEIKIWIRNKWTEGSIKAISWPKNHRLPASDVSQLRPINLSRPSHRLASMPNFLENRRNPPFNLDPVVHDSCVLHLSYFTEHPQQQMIPSPCTAIPLTTSFAGIADATTGDILALTGSWANLRGPLRTHATDRGHACSYRCSVGWSPRIREACQDLNTSFIWRLHHTVMCGLHLHDRRMRQGVRCFNFRAHRSFCRRAQPNYRSVLGTSTVTLAT